MYRLLLPVSLRPSDTLCRGRVVRLLRVGEEWGREDDMIRVGEVAVEIHISRYSNRDERCDSHSGCGFIGGVEKQNSLFAFPFVVLKVVHHGDHLTAGFFAQRVVGNLLGI